MANPKQSLTFSYRSGTIAGDPVYITSITDGEGREIDGLEFFPRMLGTERGYLSTTCDNAEGDLVTVAIPGEKMTAQDVHDLYVQVNGLLDKTRYQDTSATALRKAFTPLTSKENAPMRWQDMRFVIASQFDEGLVPEASMEAVKTTLNGWQGNEKDGEFKLLKADLEATLAQNPMPAASAKDIRDAFAFWSSPEADGAGMTNPFRNIPRDMTVALKAAALTPVEALCASPVIQGLRAKGYEPAAQTK